MGCLMLIKEVEKKLSGKHVVIIGRSNLNGKPMAQLMLRENCTVTIVHSKTKNIKQECLKAEILIAAAGVPKLVKEDWIQKNCIVIDVGINNLDGKIVGDTDYDNIKNHVHYSCTRWCWPNDYCLSIAKYLSMLQKIKLLKVYKL